MRLLSYTIGEINSKWIYYLSIRPETIKLLVGEGVVERKDAGDKLLDTGFGNFFFNGSDWKSKGNKRTNKQVRVHQTKSFCTAKEIIKIIKKPPTEWEKIFANHMSDKRFISKMYK